MANSGNDEKGKNGGAFFARTDEVRTTEIAVDGVTGIFKYRQLTAYESNKIMADCLKLNPFTGEAVLDIAEYTTRLLLIQLVAAPFDINRKNLQRLSPDVINQLSYKMRARDNIKNANNDPSVI